MSAGKARKIVARAVVAERAPDTRAAWADGRISTDQADRLFSLARTLPEEFSEAEEKLVEIVEPLSVADTGRAFAYWKQSVDGPGELSIHQQQ